MREAIEGDLRCRDGLVEFLQNGEWRVLGANKDAEIARLRADVERLTRERDQAWLLLEASTREGVIGCAIADRDAAVKRAEAAEAEVQRLRDFYDGANAERHEALDARDEARRELTEAREAIRALPEHAPPGVWWELPAVRAALEAKP